MLGNLCNFNICGVATEIFKSLPTRYSIAMVGVNVLETIAFQSSMQYVFLAPCLQDCFTNSSAVVSGWKSSKKNY